MCFGNFLPHKFFMKFIFPSFYGRDSCCRRNFPEPIGEIRHFRCELTTPLHFYTATGWSFGTFSISVSQFSSLLSGCVSEEFSEFYIIDFSSTNTIATHEIWCKSFFQKPPTKFSSRHGYKYQFSFVIFLNFHLFVESGVLLV